MKHNQLKEDLAPEKMLHEEMELVRMATGTKGVVPLVERIKAYAQFENQDQDFQMSLNFNDVQIKGLKNQESRISDKQLGMLVYGRNLTLKDGSVNPVIKDAFKCARTHLTE